MKKGITFTILSFIALIKLSNSCVAQDAKMSAKETKKETSKETVSEPVYTNNTSTEETPKAAIFASRKKNSDSTKVVRKEETTKPSKSFTRKETYK